MRIVHLVSGAGNMYCGSCLHGNTLVSALRAAGADVLLAPLYTPLRTDEENVSVDRVAFGGINVYLQQRWALFRHTPWLLDRLLDRPALLRWIGRRSATTQPEQLGPLTVSMLRGEEGQQRKELTKLLAWLKSDARPDLVHLSNVMLAGTARQITRQLGVPVVCSLSGTDVFLEKLPEPYYSQARAELRERAKDLAALIAMNGYYADFMAEYIGVPRDRIHVIRPGLNLEGHATPDQPRVCPEPATATVGFLARVCHEKGLHLLVEALKMLSDDAELPPVRLQAAGYLDAADQAYLNDLLSNVEKWGLTDRIQYLGELDRSAKIAMLQSLDVMSVPTISRESKGLPVLEAWANGVPVVVPDHGAFSEMVEETSGGLLCRPEDPASLADALKRMILDREFARQCGRQAQQAVHERYHAAEEARQTMELYREVVGSE